MDKEHLHFEPNARTALQRWWKPLLPAGIGVVLGLAILGSLSLTPEPEWPWRARCMDEAGFETFSSCRRRAGDLAREMLRDQKRSGAEVTSEEAREAQAREAVMLRSRTLQERYEREHASWTADERVRAPLRLLALVPFLLGGVATLLWIRRERYRGVQEHDITISAHQLRIDGHRFAWSELLRVELGPEEKGFRLLNLETRAGDGLAWRLPSDLHETARLEDLLSRMAPSPDEVMRQDDAARRMLAEKRELDGRR